MKTIVFAALAVIIVLAVWASGAYAHSWYTGYQNEKKELCCGGSDCAQVPDGDARAVEGGYVVERLPVGFPGGASVKLPAFIPNSRAQPGEDPAHYHLCIWNAEIKCFFVPAPGF